MKARYNSKKLPSEYQKFTGKKVTLVGSGAVGSYLIEFLSKMEIGKLRIIDFDHFTTENAVKHSCLLRIPEDVGRNKAQAVADRANTMMIEGAVANGIDANITSFGPMAFIDTDIVVLALDNDAARIYFNQIWLQIPENKRPLLIFGGTNLEEAQSNCIDGKEGCLRCLYNEDGLDEPEKKTSCAGPQYRIVDGVKEIVKTTGLASSLSAHLMAEPIRGYFLGINSVVNKRLAYSPYPNLSILETVPLKKKDCPDCTMYFPPKEIKPLEGNVLEMTLGEMFNQLKLKLGTDDFEVNFHVMKFANVAYGGLIVSDNCHSCGKSMNQIYKHESRTYFEDLICNECKLLNKDARYDAEYPKGKVIRGITTSLADDKMKAMTLFELGWPIGGFIHVIKKDINAIDILDDGIEMFTYYCKGDAELLDKVNEVK